MVSSSSLSSFSAIALFAVVVVVQNVFVAHIRFRESGVAKRHLLWLLTLVYKAFVFCAAAAAAFPDVVPFVKVVVAKTRIVGVAAKVRRIMTTTKKKKKKKKRAMLFGGED